VGELAGLHLSGEYECAHSLLDAEDDVVRYLVVDECVKREQEDAGCKSIEN
jgi:hypothetical protein